MCALPTHVPPTNWPGAPRNHPGNPAVKRNTCLSAGVNIVLDPTPATLAVNPAAPTFMVRLSTSSLMRAYSLELSVASRKPILLVSAAWPCEPCMRRAVQFRCVGRWPGAGQGGVPDRARGGCKPQVGNTRASRDLVQRQPALPLQQVSNGGHALLPMCPARANIVMPPGVVQANSTSAPR